MEIIYKREEDRTRHNEKLGEVLISDLGDCVALYSGRELIKVGKKNLVSFILSIATAYEDKGSTIQHIKEEDNILISFNRHSYDLVLMYDVDKGMNITVIPEPDINKFISILERYVSSY